MAIAQQPFGRSGHPSTRVIFGAASLSSVSQDVADRTLEVLLQHGINHIDVAASYGNGNAELRLQPWLARHRSAFFLATKTGARQADAARADLEVSLQRMGVDHVDLWQLHNLVDPIDWDVALSPGGAIEAAVEAKRQGLVKAIGVTGHGAQVAATHRRSLQRFDFDSVLLPYNYITMQNPYYAENFASLLATCQERGVAVQTIKSIAWRHWMGRERTSSPWYQPLVEQGDIELAVHWVLARPEIFLITPGDVNLVPSVLEAATRFQRAPSEQEMRGMAARLAMEPLFV